MSRLALRFGVAIWAPTSMAPDRRLARDHVRRRVASALREAMPV